MGIVKLKKVTLYGLTEEKKAVLSDLQGLGCLHIIPLQKKAETGEGLKSDSSANEALKYLLNCPQKRRQIMMPHHFDALSVEKEVLEIRDRTLELEDERDFLQHRIEQLKPFGYFDYSPLEELNHLRLWFYVLPHYRLKSIPEDLAWEVVKRDTRSSYVVVISGEEPQNMPGPRVHVGSRPLAELEAHLEEVLMEIEDLQARRVSLTRWNQLFLSRLHELENAEVLYKVAGQTYDESLLFAMQAWIPVEQLPELKEYAKENGLALLIEHPSPEETPPTLLKNPSRIASGQDLLSFYMTPNYWLSDPSPVIFFSFIVFFAMIMSDAGYGVLLSIIALAFWKRMGKTPMGRRLRILFAALSAGTILWGILVGSYFGYSPPSGSALAYVQLFDLKNFEGMMALTIIIGSIQVIIGNLYAAWQRRPSLSMLAPIGWILVIIGGLVVGFNAGMEGSRGTIGTGLLIAGGVLILGFAGAGKPFLKWLMAGFQDVTRLTSAFGDILSYLRLFALGLASSSLAIAFNGLAQQAYESSASMGILFALLILLIGHFLNFILCLVSSVVHGLRLNLIEFLNWSTPEEGVPFKPFRKK
jgi:V/A-type H+-transporting ATPase subunit I